MGSKALILIQGFAMQWYSGMSFKDKDACFQANMCMLLVLVYTVQEVPFKEKNNTLENNTLEVQTTPLFF